jgi:putative flippase GtrA
LARLPPVLGQLLWYSAIGGVLTLAYLGLYAALRLGLAAQPANIVAWLATAVADTAANRRFTFGISGRAGAVRAQGEGLLVFGLGLAITSGFLRGADALVAQPGRLLELGVLLAANLVAGLLRFLLLRVWVFAPHRLRHQR